MAEVTVKSQLEGLYKEVYGEKLENLIPDVAKLMRSVPFRETEKLGEAFNLPVIVSDEQGATYAGSDDDAFDLEAPEAMQTKNARVKGSQILMRAAIGYKAAASAVSGGKAAFLNATELIMKRLLNSISKRVEVMLLYGGSGLAKLASSVNVNATTTDITITVQSFAPGIWVGAKGAKLEARLAGVAVGTDENKYTVQRVNIVTRVLRVTGSAADIADLDAAILADPNDVDFFYFGAFGKESLGLDGIITTSGTLFEIDNTVFDLFKGQTFSAGNAPLEFEKVNSAVSQLVNYGLDSDLMLYVSPKTWRDLNRDEAALRQYDFSYKPSKGEEGHEALVYHSQNGMIEIEAHPMIKEGEAFLCNKDVLRRVGAWEVSTKTPGYGGEIFRQLEDKAGFEIRAYTDQALFSEHPSWLLKITNITNS